MTDKKITIRISYEAVPDYCGKENLLASSLEDFTLHLTQNSALDQIQTAARRLSDQKIPLIALLGDRWQLEECWHFWLGFYAPKKQSHIEWPTLPGKMFEELQHRIKVIGWARETINLPAEQLSPEELAQRSLTLIQEVGGKAVQYQLLKGKELLSLDYMGLYSVGKGSQREPVLLTIDFNPSQENSAPVFACLVGKGITFDSGGYSLKGTIFMESMKSDMGGAATVVGALALAIIHGLQKRVKLIIGCADNMVSGNAFKLGDIIHYRNGKTVEVTNSDAEGRLVLADALIDASETESPIIIDCATLTGAAKTAVGNDYHSLLSFDDNSAKQMLDCAVEQNEQFWRLPLAEFHRQQIPSYFADLNNVASASHTAGASTAAGFLSHFVKQYKKGWLHIDCSATYRKAPVTQWAAGATGTGIRTIAHFLNKKANSQ